MATTIKLVINFKNPSVHIEIMGNQFSKRKNKLLFIINIHCWNCCWYISLLKYFLSTGLSRIQMLFLWFSCQNWYFEFNWKFDIISRNNTWHNIGLFTFNHTFYAFQSFGWIKQELGQWEMVWESIYVLRCYKVDSVWITIHFSQFKYFLIIAKNVRSHLERWYIDNVHIWILGWKNSTYLSILPLQELLHWNSLHFFNWQGVYMNFNPFSLFNSLPFHFKLLHHLFPNK